MIETAVTLTVDALLLAAAALHILWAFGIWWPEGDERALVARVVGFSTAERMPGPIPSAAAAACLMFAALLPWLANGWASRLALGLTALVFLLRALMAWRPFWQKLTPQQPFRRLDQRLYGPLCLAIGAAFAFILSQRIV